MIPVAVALLFGAGYVTTRSASSTPDLPSYSNPPAARGQVPHFEAVGDFAPLTFDWSGRVGAPSTDRLRALSAEDLVVTVDGTVVDRVTTEGLDDAELLIQGARDVVVRRSVLGQSVSVTGSRTGVRPLIEHNTIRAERNAVKGLSMIVRFNEITSENDGITPTGGPGALPSVITYNRITRDGTQRGDAHHDGIQLWQGGSVTVRRNWISGWRTSAMMIKSDVGPIRRVRIVGNYLANPTGVYTLYVMSGGFGRPKYVTVRNNVFGPGRPIFSQGAVFVRSEEERADAVASGDQSAAEWIVWAGNTRSSGRPVVPPGGWRTP